MIDWIDQEGIKFLIGAVLAAGGLLGARLLRQLDTLTDKVNELHDDMIRVKHSLGIRNNGGSE